MSLFFRVRVRCQNVSCILEFLNLMVVDRRFRITIEVDSWEETNPIFLGKELDERLGLVTAEEQDRFIRQTGFSSIPRLGAQGSSGEEQFGGPVVGRRHSEDTRQPRQEWRPIAGERSISNSAVGTLGTSTNSDESEKPCHFSDRGAGESLATCPPQQAVATLDTSDSEGPRVVGSCGPLHADSASVPQQASNLYLLLMRLARRRWTLFAECMGGRLPLAGPQKARSF